VRFDFGLKLKIDLFTVFLFNVISLFSRNYIIFLSHLIVKNIYIKKERLWEEEKEAKKKVEHVCSELANKLQQEKQSLTDVINQKKDLNETLINLEKQSSDLMENLNAQTNLNAQLKAQYTNLLRMNNGLEKSNDDWREKHNNLLIQKDLIENESHKWRNLLESEKQTNSSMVARINELETTVQLISTENSRLKDRENFGLNELAKQKSLLAQLEKEKSSLELQLKNIEQNISQNDLFVNGHGQSALGN
jgi:hypothetical protein